MAELDAFLADLENAKDNYKQNWVIPYGSAYTRAHAKFEKTLRDQDDYNKLKAELFLTAATLGFGAGIGAAFGKTAFRTVVADNALTIICNNNMTRMFNAMHAVSASVPGTFIVDQVWDNVASHVNSAVKTQVASIFNGPAASASVRQPQEMQNDLERYVLRIKTATHEVGASLRDSKTLSAQQKAGFATALRNSSFYKNRPLQDLIPNIQAAADTIELSFYMVMVMNSDYWREHTIGFQGQREIDRFRRLGEVTTATTDPSYGKGAAGRSSSGFGYNSFTTVDVGYDNLGSKVLDRVNELFQARYKRDFIPNRFYQSGNTNKDAVARAERTLAAIGREIAASPAR